MAEQVSHNVVDNTQSASALAPADAAANQSNIAPGLNGTNDRKPLNFDTASIVKDVSDAAANVDGTISGTHLEPHAAEVNGIHDGASQAGSQEEAGSVDPSVTSDNEGSRADGTEQKKEDGHHMRTNSVKKPATFSKVSVTKNFLAKSASPAPAAAVKVGDKPSPVSTPAQQAALRPRLVAKTASGSQGAQRPRVGSEATGVPGASKVWNKNRPVAPPPPKHFTDEELKQQYGIHLATRLQSDENGKESKWADIDEDEEDWAPEAVVWMDGTKSAVTSESPAIPQQQKAPIQQQQVKLSGSAKPTLAIKKTELGPQKTILKPGIAVKQVAQPNRSAAASPAADKPSLTAKASPAPTKSPWAALPPVEAVPVINPPVQQQAPPPTALPPQDARAYDQQIPLPPAREIAADTFDRSWRDGEGAPRELFNSANGRYEPAPEGRRSSMRQDPSLRKPALLQRPSQTGQGPAEPSAAFQTRSNSNTAEGPGWARRRGSSVSQGSGQSARRMSVTKPSDLPATFEEDRRPGTVIGHDVVSANIPGKQQLTQKTAWDQQMPRMSESDIQAEDPVMVQERLMREKREEARKRKQEEQEREQREREERLKAKLAALEGSGKSRKEREAEAAAKAADKAVSMETPVDPANKPSAPAKLTQASAVAAPDLEAQSLPGPPTQAAQPANGQEKLVTPLPSNLPPPDSLPERPAAVAGEPQRDIARAHLSPRANARAPFGQQASAYLAPTTAYSSPGDRKQQPFARSPLASDTFSNIPGWNTTAPNSSVWGTSGIGNGTFDRSGSAFAPVPMSQQTSALLPPPGMGRPSTTNRISPPSRGQEADPQNFQPSQSSDQQRFPPPSIERSENTWGSSRHNGTSPVPGLGRQTHLPAPIAPPSRAQLQQQQQQPHQRDAISTPKNTTHNLPNQHAANVALANSRSIETTNPAPASSVGTIKETFNTTSGDRNHLIGSQGFETPEFTLHDMQVLRSVSSLSPAPPNTQTQPSGPVPTASPLQAPYKQTVENTVRIPDGSRNPAHGGMNREQPSIAPKSAYQPPLVAYQGNVNFPADPLPGVPSMLLKDQSPPPPETSSHPVFSGNVRHPNVKLPHPPPRVRLPPPMQGPLHAQQQQGTVQMPGRPVQWGPPGVVRPLVQNNEWQARFNGLFNRANVQTEVPPSPPKTPPKSAGSVSALAITSFSKAQMDDAMIGGTATVSLPTSPPRRKVTKEGFTIDRSSDVISKPAIDNMFNEELSFGSLPNVRIPPQAIYNPEIFSEPRHSSLKLPASVLPQTADIVSTNFWPKNANGLFVKIQGTKLASSNKLVRFPAATIRQTKNFGDKKVSGQYNKGRDLKNNGSGGKANGSGSSTPTPTATPMAGSRSTSFQRVNTSTQSTAGTPNAPVSAATLVGKSPAAPERSSARRGKGGVRALRGRGAPIKS